MSTEALVAEMREFLATPGITPEAFFLIEAAVAAQRTGVIPEMPGTEHALGGDDPGCCERYIIGSDGRMRVEWGNPPNTPRAATPGGAA